MGKFNTISNTKSMGKFNTISNTKSMGKFNTKSMVDNPKSMGKLNAEFMVLLFNYKYAHERYVYEWFCLFNASTKSIMQSWFHVTFLAHLSQRLKWVLPIQICLLSVLAVVNISHYYLLLQNHCANFNEIGGFKFLKSHFLFKWKMIANFIQAFGKGDPSLFKWRTMLFSKGR